MKRTRTYQPAADKPEPLIAPVGGSSATQKRTIIEIAAIQSTNTPRTLYALCNDGTLWRLEGNSSAWAQLPPIPQ